MNSIVKAVVVSLVLFCNTGLIFSQEETITAEGIGRGANEAEALMGAKRDAIEKGIGMILVSQTEIENFMLKRDIVVTKTLGSVKSFEQISKITSPDGMFEIRIKAVISKSMMSTDLASFHILLQSMNKPKVMVVINENNIGDDQPSSSAAENAVIDFLKSPYDFDVIDPNVAKTIRENRQKMETLAGDAMAAASIGAKAGAEVIITGTAISRVAENVSYNMGGMKSVQADVTLRAINCETGHIIASGNAHAAKVHISPNTAGTNAIMTASQKASEGLLKKIIEDWNKQVNNGVPLMITVKGVPIFRVKNSVVAALQQFPGVVSVSERGWNSASGLLELDIQYKGNTDGFCTKADSYKLTSGGSFAVIGQNGNRIELMVQSN